MAEKKTNVPTPGRNNGVKSYLRIDSIKNFFNDWKKLSVILALLFLVLSLFLFPPTKKSREVRYRAGDIADVDVIAPFSFSVPFTERELESNKAKAIMSCPPVYREIPGMATRLTGDLNDFYEQLDLTASNDSLTVRQRLDFVKRVIPGIEKELFMRLMNRSTRNTLKRENISLIKDLLEKGIINDASPLRRRNYFKISVITDKTEKLKRADSLISQAQLEGLIFDKAKSIFGTDSELVSIFYEITRSFLEPNLIFDREKTRSNRNAKLESIPKSFRILKNQRIISKHDKITKKQIEILKVLEEERARIELNTSTMDKELLFLGKFLRIAVLLVIFGFALYRFAPGVLKQPGRLTLGFIIILFYMFSVSIIINLPQFNYFAIPVAFVSLMISAFFGNMPALLFTLFASLMLATHTDLPVNAVLTSLFAGTAAIISMTNLRQRKNFYKVFIYVSLAYVISATSIGLTNNLESQPFLYNMLFGIISSFVCTMVVMFLMPFFESIFDITTDFTLMELSDLNRPVMKRMILEAPGTYQHSLMVANMVESVADDVGANGLLARVAAYYHDIGKLAKPEYFYENKGEMISKHEKLSPSMSALVLASHVKEGVQLAKSEKLPNIIIDAIREHHGTSVMTYFYNKALEYDSNDSVNVDDFRYQGPKPGSKENALIMLADSSEAASRSLEEPTAQRITAIIDKIFDDKMREAQLDYSGLTMNDISLIKERFIKLLTAIFHKRIAYPAQKEEEAEEKEKNENNNAEPPAGDGA
ncbi:MAG: HDIG domain-containing protein [Candidatus Krumholzibacteriota bacterium]|nr:HDIG domain-containing protein [Candidatus Krumholzibacteriota bacterium]